MTNRKIYTLVDRGYETEAAAIAAQELLLNEGYPLSQCMIEEHEIGEAGRSWQEEYADQCNRLIDWQPTENQKNDMAEAHGEGLHAEFPRQFCPECES